ncbi:MAG: anti-sigma factor antagonist [Actinomycetota bacterium]|nr:anti-sigma factor antagonist [Actinomycetota bacterium]
MERSAGFGVDARFAGEQAVLAVRGDIDLSSGAEFGAFFDAVIASGYLSVVLDLADVEFMDVAGLRLVAFAASRLMASGGALTIRSPSTKVTRTLDITWLGLLARSDTPWPAPDRSDRRLPAAVGTDVTAADRPVLFRGGSSVAHDETVDAALRVVVDLAHVAIAAADGVSVSLRRQGGLATVAASDQTVSDMDRVQYATGEGPCVDAAIRGQWSYTETLDEETRWPDFTPRAKKLGINSVLSTPLMAAGQPLGALNIYSRTPAAFTTNQQEMASAFATGASSVVSEARAGDSDNVPATARLQVLAAHEVIALAQGVIMEREGVDQHGAYQVLQRFSRRTGRPVRERAEDVVASTRRSPPRLTRGPTG